MSSDQLKYPESRLSCTASSPTCLAAACTSLDCCLTPARYLCSCPVYYGSIGPVDPAPATPVSIKAGACQLSTDVSDGMFSIFASRGEKMPFTSGIVRRPAPEPVPPPDPKANDTQPTQTSMGKLLVWHARFAQALTAALVSSAVYCNASWLAKGMSRIVRRKHFASTPNPSYGPMHAVSFLPVVDNDCLLACKKAGLVAFDFGDPAQQICAVAVNGRDWWGERSVPQ